MCITMMQTMCGDVHCRSVKQFADAFLSMKLPLHILACNGAVWVTKDAMTEDGFEVS